MILSTGGFLIKGVFKMCDNIYSFLFERDLQDMSSPTQCDYLPDDVTPAAEEAIDQEWRGYDDDGRNFHADDLPLWLQGSK